MVQVTYQGGGMDGVTSNAASEATLQLLLKAISGQGGNTGGAQGAFDGANSKTDQMRNHSSSGYALGWEPWGWGQKYRKPQGS